MQSSDTVSTTYGKIAYDPGGDIATIELDGSGRKTVTRNGTHPSWSPSGEKLVLLATTGSIDVVNSDGSNRISLTNTNASAAPGPSWSPKGGKIAFSSNKSIYSMNEDGSGVTQLTFDVITDDQPSWTPDGTKLAYRQLPGPWGQIWAMNSDGSGQVALTPTPAYLTGGSTDPAWSPNGRFIAYGCTGDCTGAADQTQYSSWEIYVMNSDGTGKQRLTFSDVSGTYNLAPSWTQDGKKIVFASTRDHVGGSDTFAMEVYIMNADGSGQTKLTNSSLPPPVHTSCRWCSRFDVR